ncbi:MAG: hypothetical protein KME57_30545 [Scytonema hyalinum WJT4-NPBG1]|nr:hypothetical protein [Scytonema hyalinum WJT4-NPBG1]
MSDRRDRRCRFTRYFDTGGHSATANGGSPEGGRSPPRASWRQLKHFGLLAHHTF